MTKPIIAAAVLMMMEEEKLDLRDPVSRFIPEFREPRAVRVFEPGTLDAAKSRPFRHEPPQRLVAAERELTVVDLLTHTAGLQSVGVPNDAIPAIGNGDTVADWVPRLARVPLDFEPGTQWAYSNTVGFEVLAHIVERLCGLPLDRFLSERLFEPLGMVDSGFGMHLARPDQAVPLDRRLAGNPCVAGTTYFSGSGGLWMTAADYGRFAQMLANGGELKGRRVLSADSVALMASNHTKGLFTGWRGIEGRGAQMGLSVLVVHDPAAAGVALPEGSYGWDGFGTRRFWVIPQAEAVIVMLMPGGNATPVHREIETAVIDVIGR
jgi:CubicO group peptidase (beta-lactamase class C family)